MQSHSDYYRHPDQPTVPKKKKHTWLLVAVAVLVLAVCLGGLTSIVSSGGEPPAGTPGKVVGTSSTIPNPPKNGPSPAAKAPAGPMTAQDIKLSVKITKKDCFGSAGCNVEYKIVATTDLAKLKATDKQWEVTYDVKGLEDVQTGTLVFQPDGIYSQQEFQSGSTSSSKKKLTAVVTSVESAGLDLKWKNVSASSSLKSKKVYVISQNLGGWPVASAVNWIDGYTGSDWVNAKSCPRGAYRCIWVKKDNGLRAPVIASTFGYNTSRVVIKVDVAYANSKGIKTQAKRKYVIAHELGHAGFIRAHNGSKSNLMYSHVGGYHYGLTASQKSILGSH